MICFAVLLIVTTASAICLVPFEPSVGASCGCVTSTGDCARGSVQRDEKSQTLICEAGATLRCASGWQSCDTAVRDRLPPVARCTGSVLRLKRLDGPSFSLESTGEAFVARMLDGGSTDDCNAALLQFSAKNLPRDPDAIHNCQPLGRQNVTLLVSDRAGRTSSCTATVDVVVPEYVATIRPISIVPVNTPLSLDMVTSDLRADLCLPSQAAQFKALISPPSLTCADVGGRGVAAAIRVQAPNGVVSDSVATLHASDASGACGGSTATVCKPVATPCAAGQAGLVTADGSVFCFQIVPIPPAVGDSFPERRNVTPSVCRLASSTSPLLPPFESVGFACIEPLDLASMSTTYHSLILINREFQARLQVLQQLGNNVTLLGELIAERDAAVERAHTACWPAGNDPSLCAQFNACPPNLNACSFSCVGDFVTNPGGCREPCQCTSHNSMICPPCPPVCAVANCLPGTCVSNLPPRADQLAAIVGRDSTQCQLTVDRAGRIERLDMTVAIDAANVWRVELAACAHLRVVRGQTQVAAEWASPSLPSFGAEPVTCRIEPPPPAAAQALTDASLAPDAAASKTSFVSVNAMLGVALVLLVLLSVVTIAVVALLQRHIDRRFAALERASALDKDKRSASRRRSTRAL